MSKDNANFFETKSIWAQTKDRLLGVYLNIYFQKLLTSPRQTCYFDCFAGKGKFDDGEDGSPLIALKTRDECLKRARTTPRPNAIAARFLDYKYADELMANISTYNNDNGIVQVQKGRFEETIFPFLKRLPSDMVNVFLYIDPYGIKELKYDLLTSFADLGFASFEMLINFNSFGLFRNACKASNVSYANDEALADDDEMTELEPTEFNNDDKSRLLMNEITGGSDWESIVSSYRRNEIDGYQAEKMLAASYKAKLREKYTYVLDMPIRLKTGQRPKYRMIHITNHYDGCYKMAENMISRSKELYIESLGHRQAGLFGGLFEHDVENEPIDHVMLETKLLESLSEHTGFARFNQFVAYFFTKNGIICKIRDITQVLKNLETNGKILVVRWQNGMINNQSLRFTESDDWQVKLKLK